MRIDLWPAGVPGEFQPFMETFLLEGASAPRGAVLVCPGGGYGHRARHEASPVAARFNALGFHAFVLEYRVGNIRFPDPQQDALRAMKIIRSRAGEWGVKPDKIAILGFSSGGHLAASAGVFCDEVDASAGDAADAVSGRPDASILCYPVIDVRPGFGHVGSGVRLGGENAPAETLEKFSLQTQVTEKTPPAFLWHSADDPGVPVQNSLEFANALWKAGATAELVVFPHARHGVGLAHDFPDIRDWPELAAKFLRVSCKF